jgi:hypothetical protein
LKVLFGIQWFRSLGGRDIMINAFPKLLKLIKFQNIIMQKLVAIFNFKEIVIIHF